MLAISWHAARVGGAGSFSIGSVLWIGLRILLLIKVAFTKQKFYFSTPLSTSYLLVFVCSAWIVKYWKGNGKKFVKIRVLLRFARFIVFFYLFWQEAEPNPNLGFGPTKNSQLRNTDFFSAIRDVPFLTFTAGATRSGLV